MRNLIKNHLEDSRIYQRVNYFNIELKNQSQSYSQRLNISYPFDFKFTNFYSPKGFKKINFHDSLRSNSPIYFEFSKDFNYLISFQHKIQNTNFNNFLKNSKLNLTILGEKISNFSFLIGIDHKLKFSTYFSINPMIFGFSYFGKNIGSEFVYSITDDQPSFSLFYYNKIFKNTKITSLFSIYGENTTLITTKILNFKLSSLYQTNFFTFHSLTKIGLTFPIYKSFFGISIEFPLKKIYLKIYLNKKINKNNKKGITIFTPIN